MITSSIIMETTKIHKITTIKVKKFLELLFDFLSLSKQIIDDFKIFFDNFYYYYELLIRNETTRSPLNTIIAALLKKVSII